MIQSNESLSFLVDLSEIEQLAINGGFSVGFSSSTDANGAGKSITIIPSGNGDKSIAIIDGKEVDLATGVAELKKRQTEIFSNFNLPFGFSINFG